MDPLESPGSCVPVRQLSPLVFNFYPLWSDVSYEESWWEAGDSKTGGEDKSLCWDTAHVLCSGWVEKQRQESEGTFSLNTAKSLRGQWVMSAARCMPSVFALSRYDLSFMEINQCSAPILQKSDFTFQTGHCRSDVNHNVFLTLNVSGDIFLETVKHGNKKA